MHVEKVLAAETTITFSRKELLLFSGVINEVAHGMRLSASQKELLGRPKERVGELLEQIFDVLKATRGQ